MTEIGPRPLAEMIAFRVCDQEFCVDIMAVRELRGWTEATPLPHSPHWMRGVINLRGAVLPIVDMAARIGLGPCTPTSRHVVVVTCIGTRLVGLLVDGVSDILEAAEGAVQPTPDLGAGSSPAFVVGLFTVGERMIGIVDLDLLLPDEEAEAA